jgi:hypothetical protein
MGTLTGAQLAQNIRKQIAEFEKACKGVDESTALRNPVGRWSPKEILSHLLGPDESGHLPMLKAFIDQDNPTVYMEAANPFFTEKRAEMSFAQLLSKVTAEYDRLAKFAATLTSDELDKQARVPMLKETPLGEFPTLEVMLSMLCGMEGSHIQFHTNHMREILDVVGTAAKE